MARSSVTRLKPVPKQGVDPLMSSSAGAWAASWPMLQYNPSDLISRKGIEIFDTMLLADQIRAAMAFKLESVLATGWMIESPEDKPEDWEVTEFVRRNLDQVENGFSRCLRNILSACSYGYSISERIYGRLEGGSDAGMTGIKRIITHSPHYLRFNLDDFGNIKSIHNDQDGEDYPREKFIVWSYNTAFRNPYGQSDLESCYRSYILEHNLYRWLGVYLERMGIPPWIAFFNPSSLDPGQQADLKAVIRNMQNATSATIPRASKDDLEIWVPTASANLQQIFLPAIELMKQDMARALLMPGHLGVSPDSTQGSLAKARVALDMFLLSLTAIQGDLGQVCQHEVINPLVDFNFQTNGVYPKFRFLEISTDDAQAICKAWSELVDLDVVNPGLEDEQHIRSMLKFPRRETDEEGLGAEGVDPATARIPFSYLKDVAQALTRNEVRAAMGYPPLDDEKAGEELLAKSVEPPPPAPVIQKVVGEPGAGPGGEPADADAEPAAAKLKAPADKTAEEALAGTTAADPFPENEPPPGPDAPGLTVPERRCDFAQIVAGLDGLEDELAQTLAAAFRKSAYAQIEAWRQRPPTVKAAPRVKLPMPDRAKAYGRAGLTKAYRLGRKDAKAEIAQAPKEFAKQPAPTYEPEEALKYLESKAGFWVTGMNEKMTEITRQEIMFGLRNGHPFTETASRLRDALGPWVGAADADPKALRADRMLTTVRTNSTDAYNQGRVIEARRSAKVGLVTGMQHSSVLDNRTTAICRSLHGKVYRIDGPDLDTLTPPLHHRCRSVLIPVMFTDEVSDDANAALHWATPEELAQAKRMIPGDFGGSFTATAKNAPKAAGPPPTTPRILPITTDELARIKTSGINGQAIDIDLGDLEDQNVLVWQYEKNGKTFTAMQSKVREAVARKLDAEWVKASAGGHAADVLDMGDQSSLVMKIYQTKVNTGAFGKLAPDSRFDIEDLRDKLSGQIAKIAGHIDAGELQATKEIFSWLEGASEVQDMLEQALKLDDAAVLKNMAFPTLGKMGDLHGKTFKLTLKASDVVPEWQAHTTPFELASFKNGRAVYTGDRMERGYGKWIRSDVDGIEALYHGTDEAHWALSNTLRLDVEGEGADAIERLAGRLKGLGVDVRRATSIDREELYLIKSAYLHHTSGPEWRSFQGRLASLPQDERIDELRGYVRQTTGTVPVAIKPPPGSPVMYRHDLSGPDWDKFASEHRLTHDNTGSLEMADLVDVILEGGGKFAPTTDKLRRGVKLSGMSPESDIVSGGGNYFFTRIASTDNATTRENRFVFKPDALKRLDAISYGRDEFGKTASDFVPANRVRQIEQYRNVRGSNETIFRHEFDLLDNIDTIVVHGEHRRDALLAVFRKHGITTLPDGRAIEDAVKVKAD